jgi:hypothetical protein
MTRWYGNFVERTTGIGQRTGRRELRARTKRFRPLFDAMEGRALLSTLMVSSPADSGPGSLRATIAAATSGDTIDFASSINNITLTSAELDIPINLTIEGPGAGALTISGGYANRVFEISNNATVTIEELTVADGAVVSANGGGILIDSGATLALKQAIVTGNSAYANSQGYYGDGGGVENDGSLTVTGSRFTDNQCSGGSYTDPITEGSAGGAIDSQGPSLSVTTSTFAYNDAVGPSTGTGEGNGGAINTASTASIAFCTFSGNEAIGRTTNGGAISAGENELIAAPPLSISNSTFTANQAVGANNVNDFTEKFGGQAVGGAIASAGPLSIGGSSFTDNIARAGNDGSNLNPIDGGPFVDSADGGGVIEFANTLTISTTTFTGNEALAGSCVAGPGGSAIGGGVASWIFSATTLTGVKFIDNVAVGGGGGPGYTGGTASGGGLDNGADSSAVVAGCYFLGNVAEGGAGGSGAAGASGAGGAIANGGGLNELESGFLGLPSDTSSVTVVSSQLGFNEALGGAGGSGSNGGTGQGGGCFIYSGTYATIDNSKIVFNAAYGGAAGAGGSTGQGVGGGLYIGTGAGVSLSSPSEVFEDFASSEGDDIFGTYITS